MDEEESDVTFYIVESLGGYVVSLEEMISEIDSAPMPMKQYLRQRFRNVKQLEEYLRGLNDRFFMENGKVTVYDSDLEQASENAVRYFEEELNFYNEPPYFMNFKGHIGQAGEDVQDFIRCFYPGVEFKQFLLAHPDVFVVFDDDTVFLIENEAVDYFEECLENEREGWFYMNLRGCVGQAPAHVIKFINDYYPEERFLEFLEKNSDVFHIEDGSVYLTDNDASD